MTATETGQRVDVKTNRKIQTHYIQKMIFKLNGQQVTVADTGTGVSRRPLIAVRLKGTKAGDTTSVNWTDNIGESGSAHTRPSLRKHRYFLLGET